MSNEDTIEKYKKLKSSIIKMEAILQNELDKIYLTCQVSTLEEAKEKLANWNKTLNELILKKEKIQKDLEDELVKFD